MYKNKKNILFNIFIIMIYTITIFQFFIKNIYENYIYFYIVQLLMMLFMILFNNKIGKETIKFLMFIILNCIYIFFVICKNNGGIGSIIIYIGMFINLYWIKDIKFNKTTNKYLYILFFILGMFFSLNARAMTKNYLLNHVGFNPNLSAQIILYCAIYINILGERIGINKTHKALINFIFLFGIIFTESRSSLIAMLFLMLMLLLGNKRLSIKKVKIIFVCIVILGISIPYIYVNMYKNDVDLTIPFTKKDLYTGREVIWSNIYEYMKESDNLLFGIGSKQALGDRYIDTIDAHNIYLAALNNYGIIATIIFYTAIIIGIFKGINLIDKKENFKIIAGFISIFICGFFENPIVWEKTILLFISLFAFISRDKLQEEKNEETIIS